MPSFFSYRRILQVLRNEVQEFDYVLSKLHKWNYSDYDVYIFVPLLLVFFVIFQAENGRINLNDDFLFLFLMYFVFSIFVAIVEWIRNSLFHKNEDITKSLQQLVDSINISNTIIVVIIIDFIFTYTAASLFLHNNVIESLFQIFLLFIVGMLIMAYFLFLNAIIVRSIEQKYLIIQKKKHELPEMYVKIKMKNFVGQIIGSLDSINFNLIIVEESDGFRLSLEYNKIESISAKLKVNQ